MKTKQEENFGRIGTDKVTGFTGTITGFALYMYGCGQYMITPEKSKEGKRQDAEWFDEGRIEIGKIRIKPREVKVEKNGCEKQEHPSKN